MNFLAPQYFFGLFAIAIPLAVHFFNFRKTRVIYFSSIRFLKKISEETSSKNKLKHLLLLLSRLLFVVFLVLAFTQPVLNPKKASFNSLVQIYVDNSYSMSNEAEIEVPALVKAIEFAHIITDLYPQGTQFRLLTNDFAPFSNRFRSAEEVKDILSELEYSKYSRTAAEIHDNLFSEFEKQTESDSYWISDFQSSVYHNFTADSSHHLRLIPISNTGHQNVFIDTLYISDPFSASASGNRLKLKINNTSHSEIKNLLTRIFINENQATTRNISIPPEGFSWIDINLQTPGNINNTGKITFEEYPVIFDNEFHFCIPKRQKVKIIEIGEQTPNNYIKSVYGNKDLFSYQFFTAGNIDFSALESADLIIVNGIHLLNPSLTVQLNSFILKNGHILLLPGKEDASQQLRSVLGMTIKWNTDTISASQIAPPDFENPFFTGVFEDKNKNMAMPEAKFLIEGSFRGSPLLSFSNKNPFLISQINDKNIYLTSCPLESGYTNFVHHALFVPVLYKIAFLSQRMDTPLYYSFNSNNINLPADSLLRNEIISIGKDNKQKIIPEQKFTGNTFSINLSDTDIIPGNYSVYQQDKKVSNISLNFNKIESDLRPLETEEIANIFPGTLIELSEEQETDNYKKVLEEQHMPKPLWKYLILLAILALVAEVLIYKLMKS